MRRNAIRARHLEDRFSGANVGLGSGQRVVGLLDVEDDFLDLVVEQEIGCQQLFVRRAGGGGAAAAVEQQVVDRQPIAALPALCSSPMLGPEVGDAAVATLTVKVDPGGIGRLGTAKLSGGRTRLLP